MDNFAEETTSEEAQPPSLPSLTHHYYRPRSAPPDLPLFLPSSDSESQDSSAGSLHSLRSNGPPTPIVTFPFAAQTTPSSPTEGLAVNRELYNSPEYKRQLHQFFRSPEQEEEIQLRLVLAENNDRYFMGGDSPSLSASPVDESPFLSSPKSASSVTPPRRLPPGRRVASYNTLGPSTVSFSPLAPPPPPLLRPKTFWKNAERSALVSNSYSPSSHLVRRSTFIAAGLDLPAPSYADLSALSVETRTVTQIGPVVLPSTLPV